MKRSRLLHRLIAGFGFVTVVASCQWLGGGLAGASADGPATRNHGQPIQTVPGMPPVLDPANLYSGIASKNMSPATAGELYRVYVPNRISGDVYVIDPELMKVVGKFRVGLNPQHVVPSYDLQTLWVVNNAESRTNGSVTPINPRTAKPGRAIPVDDPYNMYFTPDGRSAIVVAEESERLDFRDPHTMALQYSLPTPGCAGINHADFSIDGTYALFTCEYAGGLAKIDMVHHQVVGYLKLNKAALGDQTKAGAPARTNAAALNPRTGQPASANIRNASFQPTSFPICSTDGMPQDVRISPDGRLFYVADMLADGVYLIDGDKFTVAGFIPTGLGAHGLYPSRDGTKLYVANRGSHRVEGRKHGKGSVSVIDFATNKVVANWPIPGGGSPDMGNVSPDGKYLWLSGRFDNVVYRFDTTKGSVDSMAVGREPHGLTVWPQPGRYSLGHTGNLR
jgi:DNA-binding beta-propeller fold protein YncE